jgi:hypothetical protein
LLLVWYSSMLWRSHFRFLHRQYRGKPKRKCRDDSEPDWNVHTGLATWWFSKQFSVPFHLWLC